MFADRGTKQAQKSRISGNKASDDNDCITLKTSAARPRAAAGIVIGLDFGTTYSGVAYADSTVTQNSKLDKIQLMINWPGQGSFGSTEKVPSRILYEDPPSSNIKWGNYITHKDKGFLHTLMKLRLDQPYHSRKHSGSLSQWLSSSLSFSDGTHATLVSDPNCDSLSSYRSAVDVVSDYLAAMRDQVYSTLENQYGSAILEAMDKKLVITVPAIWSERAKDLTLKAVEKANWRPSKTLMVTEPEAAALYSLRWMSEGANKEEVQAGDSFVLCDAGANFLVWLRDWLGPETYAKIPAQKLKRGSPLLTKFEDAKRVFSGDDEEIILPLPRELGIEDDVARNISEGDLVMTNDQMRTLFSACVNRVIELISDQIVAVTQNGRAKPKMVLCVGGFCMNEYLFRCINEHCVAWGIVARRPLAPWSAVARGAVCKGLEGIGRAMIKTRRARRHYGTKKNTLFIPGVHHADDRYVSRHDGRVRAAGQMAWLVNKGDLLPDQPVRQASIELWSSFFDEESRHHKFALFISEQEEAPKRYRGSSVRQICRVKADFSSVPDREFGSGFHPDSGKLFHILQFTLVVTFGADRIKWSFEVAGKEYVSVNVSYDVDDGGG